MSKFNPKSDIVFLKVFADDRNRTMSLAFINALTNKNFSQIRLMETYDLTKYMSGDLKFLTFKLKDEDGTWKNINIMPFPSKISEKELIYYITNSFSSQVKSINEYEKLSDSIFIILLDYKYFNSDSYKKEINFKDEEGNSFFKENINLIFFELPKFNEKLNEGFDLEKKWLYSFNNLLNYNEGETPSILAVEKEIDKFFEKVQRIEMDKIEIEIYEVKRRFNSKLEDEINIRVAYELKKLEKMAIEKGRDLGREDGVMIGAKEKAKEIAINLLK